MTCPASPRVAPPRKTPIPSETAFTLPFTHMAAEAPVLCEREGECRKRGYTCFRQRVFEHTTHVPTRTARGYCFATRVSTS